MVRFSVWPAEPVSVFGLKKSSYASIVNEDFPVTSAGGAGEVGSGEVVGVALVDAGAAALELLATVHAVNKTPSESSVATITVRFGMSPPRQTVRMWFAPANPTRFGPRYASEMSALATTWPCEVISSVL
jgi:hypothetical protein